MARRAGSGPIGWLLLGVLAGAAATVALYLFLTREPAAPALEVSSAPQVRMSAPPLPAEPAAAPALPSLPVPLPAARPAPPTRDAQIADDAAATGMTGPSAPDDPAMNQPTN